MQTINQLYREFYFNIMNCYWCNTELIVGGDIDIDESMYPNLYAEYSVITNLSCPKCFAEVEVLKKRNAYD